MFSKNKSSFNTLSLSLSHQDVIIPQQQQEHGSPWQSSPPPPPLSSSSSSPPPLPPAVSCLDLDHRHSVVVVKAFNMDIAQWPQDIGLVKPMEELMPSTTTAAATTAAPMAGAAASNSSRAPQVMERTRARPHKEQALNCPRCNSTNTKFCYYNNYSLTQPRYFCKTCRRYWTEGGSLRNVPVGGGSRKNKRSSSLSASAAAATAANSTSTSTYSSSAAAAAAVAAATVAISNASKKVGTDHHLIPPAISLSTTPSQAPNFHEGQDLKLAFPHHSLPAEFNDFPNLESTSATNNNSSSNSNRSNPVSALSAMELLRNGMAGRSLGQFMQMPMAMPEYPAGFELQEFRRPPLSFPLDGISSGDGAGTAGGYGSMQGVQESDGGGRMLFPFEDLKPVVSSSTAPDQFEQSRVQGGDHSGFWNGMIGGGGSW